MFRSNLHKATKEMRALVREAQDFLDRTDSTATHHAQELRSKGVHLLNAGLSKAHDLQEAGMSKSKEMVDVTGSYIQRNPWRSVAVSGTVLIAAGVLLGMSLSRRG